MSPNEETILGDESNWLCANCGVPLEISKVDVAYLGSGFPVDLARCPSCGLVFIPEELALGRMLDVEQQLEDK
jgi:rubredoxin